jgi:hypothetical protein
MDFLCLEQELIKLLALLLILSLFAKIEKKDFQEEVKGECILRSSSFTLMVMKAILGKSNKGIL